MKETGSDNDDFWRGYIGYATLVCSSVRIFSCMPFLCFHTNMMDDAWASQSFIERAQCNRSNGMTLDGCFFSNLGLSSYNILGHT